MSHQEKYQLDGVSLHLKNFKLFLTPTLSIWPLRVHTTLKSIFWETLFLDQLHDFSLLSLNSFFILIYEIKIFEKKFLDTKIIQSHKLWSGQILTSGDFFVRQSNPDSVGVKIWEIRPKVLVLDIFLLETSSYTVFNKFPCILFISYE